MLEEAAEQQATNFFHRVLWEEGDGRNKMVLLTAALYLAQEVLKYSKQKAKHDIITHQPPSHCETTSSGISALLVPSQYGPECCCQQWPARKAVRDR